MDFRKTVKTSKCVFKPQHSEWAKCTLETDGTADIGGLRLWGCVIGRKNMWEILFTREEISTG